MSSLRHITEKVSDLFIYTIIIFIVRSLQYFMYLSHDFIFQRITNKQINKW